MQVRAPLRDRTVLVTTTIRIWVARGRTTGWAVAEQFAGPLAQFVLTPFLLHRMEPHQFGLWVIAQSLVVGAPTLSLGRSIALLSVLPRYSGVERDARARSLVLYTLRLIAATSLGAAAAVLSLNALAEQLWPYLAHAALYLVLVVGFLALIECESTLNSALKSYRAYPQATAIEIAGRAMQVVLTLALVDAGAPATKILTLVMIATASKLALKSWVVRQLVGPRDCTPSAPANAALEMSHIGFWSWVNVLSGIAFYSFDRWAVGYFMGSVALSAYSVCSQLAQLTHSIPAAAAQMLTPWAASKGIKTSRANDARQLRNVAVVGAGLACLAPLVLLATAPVILKFWVGPAFAAENTVLLRHLAFVFLLLSINIPFFSILIGLGFARYAALLTLAAGSLYAVSAIAIAPQNPVSMADLKLIYAVVGLVFVVKLLQTLKGTASE